MRDKGCLIIDDVDAALSLMTDAGRAAAAEPASHVREEVVRYAARRRWTVVSYDAYLEWSQVVAARDGGEWVILDPLFPTRGLPQRGSRLRVTRSFRLGIFEVAPSDRPWSSGDCVSVLDDAAASGATLRYVTRIIERTRAQVRGVAMCASTRLARDGFRAVFPRVRWQEFCAGDWVVLHLRDGCPHLPHTGRRSDRAPLTGASGGKVEIRTPAYTLPGTPWQSLYVVGAIREAIRAAIRSIASRLTCQLGRPAVVGDLALLAESVSVSADRQQFVATDTPLGVLAE